MFIVQCNVCGVQGGGVIDQWPLGADFRIIFENKYFSHWKYIQFYFPLWKPAKNMTLSKTLIKWQIQFFFIYFLLFQIFLDIHNGNLLILYGRLE